MESRIIEAEAARDKAERAKVKAQQEAEEACREIMEITTALKKQRMFDQMFAEEKATTAKAMADRDLAQHQARDAETRHLYAIKDLKSLQAQLDTMEK
ncbi:hypothetical protein GCK32_003702 [Trichostrongylus colubriformis]|uniref:Uncharacterized protein n=1 Tax=Trichostrongylus colubriformis TaxID=6319 RepID=A0AAN8IQS7_TRICO